MFWKRDAMKETLSEDILRKKKRAFIVLGNGFTIDFLQHYATVIDSTITERIDVCNLFRLGDRINSPWDRKPGLLSYKNFPTLWMLGARPSNTAEESVALIADIITCANVYLGFLNKNRVNTKINTTIAKRWISSQYLRAYSELLVYLKYLFCYYNTYITDGDLHSYLKKEKWWGWLKFFESIKNNNYQTIDIVTYNYDVWLERIFDILGIKYNIETLEKYDGREPDKSRQEVIVRIIKPHGSISFLSNASSVTVDQNELDAMSYDERMDYIIENIEGLNFQNAEIVLRKPRIENCENCVIIPPSGEAHRFGNKDFWAREMRQIAEDRTRYIGIHAARKVDVVLCGISYGYVDREEIDELLVNLYHDIDLTLVNPRPARELNAVLTSLFKNYRLQSSSTNIGDILLGGTY